MPSNKGFILSVKNNNSNYIALYPNTILSQVIGSNNGSVYGPYVLTLSSSNWVNNQQTVSLNGVSSTDILFCEKVLTGTQEEMIAQDNAYNLLLPTVGVESLQNEVKFTCSSTPTVDFQVQVSWTK